MTWTVADVMSREVVTVGPQTPFKTCADLMRVHEVSALPVVGVGNHVVGIISEADLMRVAAAAVQEPGLAAHREDVTPPVAGGLMTRDVVTIRPGSTIAAAARLMADRHVKRLPVVDAGNRLVGIVSRADVLRVFLRSDESIRKEAHHLLDELPLLGRGRVQVEVRDGVVRLLGEVENSSLTGILVRLVGAVPGVVGVEDHLHPVAAPADLVTIKPKVVAARHG